MLQLLLLSWFNDAGINCVEPLVSYFCLADESSDWMTRHLKNVYSSGFLSRCLEDDWLTLCTLSTRCDDRYCISTCTTFFVIIQRFFRKEVRNCLCNILFGFRLPNTHENPNCKEKCAPASYYVSVF